MSTMPPICISHATGAGGADVGRLVSDRLGLRYADDEVISGAAEWADVDPELVADVERRKSLIARLLGNVQPGPRLPAGGTSRTLLSDSDLRAVIVDAVASLVREGGVVIVAHAASFTVAAGDALRVLVTASAPVRCARIAAERGISVGEAEKATREEDGGRAEYLKRFYGVEQELPTHYDLVISTDVLSPDEAADVVIAAASRASARAPA